MRFGCLRLFAPVLNLCFQTSIQAQNTPDTKQGPRPVYKANARAVVVDVVVTKGNDTAKAR
jgi:hypothetical protein